MYQIPSAVDIQRTVALNDRPNLRNLQVTQGYHDLSAAGVEFTGGGNLNWCTFACWSSKMIGTFLRTELLTSKLFGDLGNSESYARWISEINAKLPTPRAHVALTEADLKHPLRRVQDEATSSLAAGNARVYGELGTVFSSMITVLGNDSQFEDSRLQQVIAPLKDGSSKRGGQTLLKAALRNYYRARFEDRIDAKAELVLLANLQVGLHEQTRLQSYIAGFVQAPVVDTITLPIHQTGAGRSGVVSRMLAWSHNLFIKLMKPGARELMHAWNDIATQHLMVLELPYQTLRLGRDVEPAPGSPIFPKVLETIEHPELAALLKQFGAGAATAVGSAARDWTVLDQRIRYISVLFRSHHFDSTLLGEPFTVEQRQSIAAGIVPPDLLRSGEDHPE